MEKEGGKAKRRINLTRSFSDCGKKNFSCVFYLRLLFSTMDSCRHASSFFSPSFHGRVTLSGISCVCDCYAAKSNPSLARRKPAIHQGREGGGPFLQALTNLSNFFSATRGKKVSSQPLSDEEISLEACFSSLFNTPRPALPPRSFPSLRLERSNELEL